VFLVFSRDPFSRLANVLTLALVSIKLSLEVCLGILRSCEGAQGNFEFLSASRAYPDSRSRTEPLEHPQPALRHNRPFSYEFPPV
jgi:hypothetical protein